MKAWLNLIDLIKKKDKNRGLQWAVLITWLNFPLLYWGVSTDKPIIIITGFVLLTLGNLFALYFG